ncbi:MAG: hypothetical protein OK456_10745 [Thaumarchaeota archaeon]|nr:hypothetical protein [Nitrososphaerota archaeon]
MAIDPSKIAAGSGLTSKINITVAEAATSGVSSSGSTVGVAGVSVTNDGVLGESTKGNGVEGDSNSGPGVYGSSQTGPGVSGTSVSGNGVSATSTNSNGIYAKGKTAGLFDGEVTVNGALSATGALSAASLKTSGEVNAGSVTTSGNVTANDVMLTGADLAEDFFSTMDARIEPGTVVVINEAGGLGQSQQAYDKRVAGVVSGAGSFKPAIVMDRMRQQGGGEAPQIADSRVSVALVGKVYCKVDAAYARIEVGDLLTTSPRPGYAMKANDQGRAFGAVIGKALAPLDSGTGLVPILVALQ